MPSPSSTSSGKRKAERSIPMFLQRKSLAAKGVGDAPPSPEGSSRGSGRRSRSGSSSVSTQTLDPHRTFTAAQLEDYIWKASQTMVELQKQIQRGEETYYEETQTHGSSLYRGFETFIDARDVGTMSGPTSSSSRRMPGDYRWFSSSCFNISRFMKQRPFIPVAPTPETAPLSGQKRPAAVAAVSSLPPSKERKVDKDKHDDNNNNNNTEAVVAAEESTADAPKTPDNNKEKKGSGAEPKQQQQRRTTRKRKANA